MSDGPEYNLYPAIEPYNTGTLKVSEKHTIFYEECGNKDGLPVVFFHGGPGGGITPRDRRFFDPKAYRIILLDQRGAGKSTPSYSIEENDTWNIVADVEKLREHLKINKWVIFGGSWGSTLSLSYSETHPDRCIAVILRGIFTLRDEEIKFFYQEGAHFLFPDEWERYIEPIPENERTDLVSAYYKRLTGNNEEEKKKCAKAWSRWECATSRVKPDHDYINKASGDTWALAFARIECHFFVNKGWFKPNQLIDNSKILKEHNIPVSIVQGRYDIVCPMKTAWDLHKALPHADFFIIDDAGHSASELGISNKLVEICDKYKTLKA